MTLAGDGTRLWALPGGRDFGSGTSSPVQIWVTADGKNWTNSAQLPNSHRVSGLSAAFGPLGGVVIADAKSWYSAHDAHWHVATNTLEIDQMFITGRKLFGIGINRSHDTPAGLVWRASLPSVASDNAPTPAPVAKPGNQGC